MKGSRNATPLVRAAAEASVGYLVMRDWVMRGKIRGWQDPRTRRWYVDRLDLRRYIRSRVQNGATAVAPPHETPPPPPTGWMRLVGTFTVDDFIDNSRGPATLERVAQLALTPTGEAFSTDQPGEPIIPVVTLPDRVAAIAFLAAFLPSMPESESEPLVLCARDLFERFALWSVLYQLACGDSTAGGAALQPRERPLTVRERMIALAFVRSLHAGTPDSGPPGISGAAN